MYCINYVVSEVLTVVLQPFFVVKPWNFWTDVECMLFVRKKLCFILLQAAETQGFPTPQVLELSGNHIFFKNRWANLDGLLGVDGDDEEE